MALTLSETIQILESGDWCALRFLTADIMRGKGGKVIELAKCRIVRRQGPTNNTSSDKPAASFSNNKDPRHQYWFTRNVETQNRSIIKVHPILITHINHQSVL